MGIFSTLHSFIGNSESHYSNSAGYAKNAVDHAKKSGAAVCDVASAFASPNSLYALGASYFSFEHIAGKVIAANSSFQFANYFAGGELSMAAHVTQKAAMTLVADPVSCMLGLMGTSILAANPTATYNVIKKTGEATYEFACASINTVAATAEFGLGVVSDVIEAASHAEDYTAKVFETFDNPIDSLKHLAGDLYNMLDSEIA